jgi:hypothetical protein
LIAYIKGGTPRTRLHGLQSVIFGVVWPACLFVASWIDAVVTRAVFVAFGVVWLALLLTTAVGADPPFPGARRLARIAQEAL